MERDLSKKKDYKSKLSEKFMNTNLISVALRLRNDMIMINIILMF